MKLRSLFIAALLMCASSAVYGAVITQCPPAGIGTGCGILITVTAVDGSGAATSFFTTAASSPTQPPYENTEDTLIGVQNNSGGLLKILALTANPVTDLFG